MDVLKFGLAFLASCCPLAAATVSTSTGFGLLSGLQLANVAGVPYAAGNYYVSVGTFTSPPVSASDLLGYAEFAARPSPVTGSLAGKIAGNFTATHPAAPELFNGREIYVVAGNGLSIETSTEVVILRSSSVPWLFPGDVTSATAVTIQLRSAQDAIGVWNTCVVDNQAGPDLVMPMNLAGQCIPEPPVSGIAVWGLAGALGMRRRSGFLPAGIAG